MIWVVLAVYDHFVFKFKREYYLDYIIRKIYIVNILEENNKDCACDFFSAQKTIGLAALNVEVSLLAGALLSDLILGKVTETFE